MNINIGFKFSEKKTNLLGDYWVDYEVVGFRYGNSEAYSHPDFKSKEDILQLKQYIQIITLTSNQLSIFWKPLKELESKISEDMKLSNEYKNIKIF